MVLPQEEQNQSEPTESRWHPERADPGHPHHCLEVNSCHVHGARPQIVYAMITPHVDSRTGAPMVPARPETFAPEH